MEHLVSTPQRGFAAVVRQRLSASGISQRDAASKTGIPLTTLNRRLTGNSPFSVVELAALAHLFGVPVSLLAFEAEESESGAA